MRHPKIYDEVATLTDTAVFIRKGFHGSRWVAAYRSHILGLPVCALHSSGVQVSISNDHSDAKIVLDLSAEVTLMSFSLLVD